MISGLRARLQEHPVLALLPLRAFLGVTFAWAGLSKLADPGFFDAHSHTSLQGQLALVRDTSPLSFMLGVVADHAVVVGVVIAVAEIAVGFGVLLGLWTRLAAVGGLLLALSFYLTISWRTRPYYYGADIVFVFAWLPFVLTGAPVLSLDAWRAGRPQLPPAPRRALPPAPPPPEVDPARRAVLATGVTGVAVIAAAGIDAAIGHAGSASAANRARLDSPPSPSRAGTPSAGPSSAAPASSEPPPSSAAPTANGQVIASTRKVPVGGAMPFTDPATGDPAYVVQPAAGSYKAFSAVCTHAGCTVAFDKGSEEFVCPCHGGLYDARTGQVLGGPPPAPLPPIPVEAVGGQLIVPDGG